MAQAQLAQKLTLFQLTLIAIGACIGSGIFASPNHVVVAVPHHGWAMATWALGGALAMTGALTLAALGGRFPRAGGVYEYIRQGYGNATAFMFGWITFSVINTGALAALAVLFTDYVQYIIPSLTGFWKTLLAVTTILTLTGVNMLGVSVSGGLASLLTVLKVTALVAIIGAGLAWMVVPVTDIVWDLEVNTPKALPTSILAGMIGVLWAIGGWHHASYLAGEAQRPAKDVPKAMVVGVLVVTVLYLLANLSYMRLLPLQQFQESKAVAGDALAAVLPWGGYAAALTIAVSVFGTIAIYTMSAPRIYYSMAQDGIFWPKMAELHPRYKTPIWAMGIQAIWACLLVSFWGTFGRLISFVTFMDIAFMGMAGFSIFLFRYRDKKLGLPNTLKVPGYPVVPAIFCFISFAFVLNTLFVRPMEAGAGLVLLIIGWFAYKRFRRS